MHKHFLLSLCLHHLTPSQDLIATESESEVAQSCLTFCNPVDCSPPGSSIQGILLGPKPLTFQPLPCPFLVV